MSTESMGELIHKKKEAKKKQKAKGLKPIGNRKGSTQSVKSLIAIGTEVVGQQDQKAEALDRTRNQILNQEIDDLICNLVMEGIASEEYTGWYAKCMHVLGIQKVNQLAINARNGKNPQHLFSYKLKGALQLHYKRQVIDD